MTEPTANIVLDSLSPNGDRLTTMEIKCHRFVLAEFNTHRMFSRNSASSRAIPVSKQLERVRDDPALPLVWPSEQPGMQGGEPLSDEDVEKAKKVWLGARDLAALAVETLTLGKGAGLQNRLHKSVANRLLEPFMWHTIIVSGTDWSWKNFFGLRCSPLAQPEIRAVAEEMRAVYLDGVPTPLHNGQWHLPYIMVEDYEDNKKSGEYPVDLRQVSAARCARVSYLTQNGKRDLVEDVKLCERLCSADPMHSSPLEHVASPYDGPLFPLGNFEGWKQFRHEVEAQRGARQI